MTPQANPYPCPGAKPASRLPVCTLVISFTAAADKIRFPFHTPPFSTI
jgi:hypothetical protein